VGFGVKQFCALPHSHLGQFFIYLTTMISTFPGIKILSELNFPLRTIDATARGEFSPILALVRRRH
jgi:hypothetical protein